MTRYHEKVKLKTKKNLKSTGNTYLIKTKYKILQEYILNTFYKIQSLCWLKIRLQVIAACFLISVLLCHLPFKYSGPAALKTMGFDAGNNFI